MVKAKLLEIYIPGASIIGHSLARDRTINSYLNLINLAGMYNKFYNKSYNQQPSLALGRQATYLLNIKTQYSNDHRGNYLTPKRKSFLQPLNLISVKLPQRNFTTTPRLNNHEG